MKVRGRLFWKYVVLFVLLGSGVPVTSGLIEIYFSFQENKSDLVRIRSEKTETAAPRIEQYIFRLGSVPGSAVSAGTSPLSFAAPGRAPFPTSYLVVLPYKTHVS